MYINQYMWSNAGVKASKANKSDCELNHEMYRHIAAIVYIGFTIWSLDIMFFISHSWPSYNMWKEVWLDSPCFCLQNLTSLTEDDADLLLNLTTSETEGSLNKHLPTGAPSLQVASATCLMTQRDYITGYNYEVCMPVWVAYTLDKQVTACHLTRWGQDKLTVIIQMAFSN